MGELRCVAIEIALEHGPDAADRAVALPLVEQLVHHRAQRAPVAEELLERPRQSTVAVREVRPKRLLERARRPLVDLFGLAHHPLELGSHGIDVHGHAGVLQRDQADAQGTLGDRATLGGRPLPDEGGKGRIRDR